MDQDRPSYAEIARARIDQSLQVLDDAMQAQNEGDFDMYTILENCGLENEAIQALMCNICLSPMDKVVALTSKPGEDKGCSHSFCETCIKQWDAKQKAAGKELTCPKCSRQITGWTENLAAKGMLEFIAVVVAKFHSQEKIDQHAEGNRLKKEIAVERLVLGEKEEEFKAFQQKDQQIQEANEAELLQLRQKLQEFTEQSAREQAIKDELEAQLETTRQQGSQINNELKSNMAAQLQKVQNAEKAHQDLLRKIKAKESQSKAAELKSQQELKRLAAELAEHQKEAERLANESKQYQDQVKTLNQRLSLEQKEVKKSQDEVNELKTQLQEEQIRRKEIEDQKKREDAEKLRLAQRAAAAPNSPSERANVNPSVFKTAVGGVYSLFSQVNSVIGTFYPEHWQGGLQADQFEMFECRGPEINSNVRRAKDKAGDTYAAKTIKLVPLNKVQEKGMVENVESVLSPEYLLNTQYYSAFREPMLISRLDHSNIVKIKGIIKKSDSIVAMMSYCGCDLQYFSYGTPASLMTIEQIQAVSLKLLSALSYLHSADVVHRNLSSTAIMVQFEEAPLLGLRKLLSARLGSFSSARSLVLTSTSKKLSGSFEVDFDRLEGLSKKMWRLAPELALLEACGYVSPQFDWKKCDVWAFGCMLATLLRAGDPLFKSKDYQKHIQEIMKVNECRPKSLEQLTAPEFPIQAIWPHKGETDLRQAVEYIPSPKLAQQNVFKANPRLAESCVQLITQMLSWNPKDRPTFQECLGHPFFKDIECPPIMNATQSLKESLTDNHLVQFVKGLL